MKIVITTGGTSESIDRVRKITNSGTGKLGAMIATKLLNREDIDEIFYICTPKSVRPQMGVAITNNRNIFHIIEIENTMELKDAVEKVLRENKIDYFVHSMAVSDYMVDYVTTAELLAKDLDDSDDYAETIKKPMSVLDNKSKLSSNKDNLVVVLKQTPKVIKTIKEISPNTKLFGFKLLENVEREYLIDIATELMEKNNCDYVIANDLKDIKAGTHKALLLNNKNKDILEMNGKEEIANMISSKMK